MVRNKYKVVEVGGGGVFLVPLPTDLLKVLGWKDGDELRIEPVTTRAGLTDYLVVEKKV